MDNWLVLLMNNLLFLFMNNGLMLLINVLFMDYWLNVLMNDWLMVFMNYIFVFLLNNLLVMFMNNFFALFFDNWRCSMLLDNWFLLMLMHLSLLYLPLIDWFLFMSDYLRLTTNLLARNSLLSDFSSFGSLDACRSRLLCRLTCWRFLLNWNVFLVCWWHKFFCKFTLLILIKLHL